MLSEYEERSREDQDIMNPGGSVEPVKPKRTRAPNKAKDGGTTAVKAEGGSGAGIYLLVDADKKATPVEPENLRGAIARTWMDSTLTLYKAVPVNAEYIVK